MVKPVRWGVEVKKEEGEGARHTLTLSVPDASVEH